MGFNFDQQPSSLYSPGHWRGIRCCRQKTRTFRGAELLVITNVENLTGIKLGSDEIVGGAPSFHTAFFSMRLADVQK